MSSDSLRIGAAGEPNHRSRIFSEGTGDPITICRTHDRSAPKLADIFGRKVSTRYRGKLEAVIADLYLPNPVIRSNYRDGTSTQYVRDHLMLIPKPRP